MASIAENAATPAIAPATPEQPVYGKVQGEASRHWMITCDEGWRTLIICTGMYEHAADWLLGILGRQPYAGGH